MKRLLPFLFLLTFSLGINAQIWVDKMMNPEQSNFYEIQREFNAYWKDKEIEKGKGYKQFRRWEQHWQSRVKPDGSFYESGINERNFKAYLQQYPQVARNSNSNWQPLGPSQSPGGYAGLGRIGAIAFHPSDSNVIWVGSAGGGLWKTTNGGKNWTTTTDTFPVLGISSIIIDKTNPNIMYVATGDGDAGDNASVGILKSIDGGVNWTKTGLTWATSNQRRIRKIIQSPDDPTIILVAATNGIHRSTDAGATFSLIKSGSYFDLEAHPKASSHTFYISTGNQILKSTDNGATWFIKQTFSGTNRIALAIAPSADSIVYALCSKSADSGLMGVFRSDNRADTFILKADKPNILSGKEKGDATGGQGWYDLVITVDPSNADIVYTGGITTWKSIDGGVNWKLNSFWYQISGVPAVHADKHVFEWQNNKTLWEGNDGGVYKTNNGGTNWTYLSSTMEISQMYRMSVSQLDNKAIAGLQDNGTKLRQNNGTWSDVLGGDGMQCGIHPKNQNVMYGCIQNGELHRSNNGGGNWVDIQDNIPGKPAGAWITPHALHASNPNLVVAGYKEIYKSYNQGGTWVTISNKLSTANMNFLFFAPSDTNYIYASRADSLYKTSDGGKTWARYYTPSGGISGICIHPKNPEILWATRSGYSNGSKVFKSVNGGMSWTNVSGNLPNIPANCIEYQVGTRDGIYVGMDVGVYYRDSTMTEWVLFANGLPNAEVSDLDIKYDEGKIYLSSYGRGMWKSDWFNCSVDSSLISADVCKEYKWSGTTYSQSGVYTKTYKNKFGCDSIVSLNLIVRPTSDLSLKETVCDAYTLNKQTYTKSGIYTQVLKNASGCDSTITLDLTVLNSNISVETIAACENYGWQDSTYSESGTYTRTFTNQLGCDSTLTLHLTIHKNEVVTLDETSCTFYNWNGSIYKVSGTYSQDFESSFGCDSSVILHLTIDTIIYHQFDVNACTSYFWDGKTLTESGQYLQKYSSSTGCDSIVTVRLTIFPTQQTTWQTTACERFVWNNIEYKESGTFTQKFQSIDGCDSTVTLQLTILPKVTKIFSERACGSYTWNGTIYEESGTYEQVFKNSNGCDSIVTIQLTILENTFSEDAHSACDFYFWNGEYLDKSGTYQQTVPNHIGCDSVMTLHLTILTSSKSEITVRTCKSYTWFGETYTTSGEYQQKLKNEAGCDSTISLKLTILEPTAETIKVTACEPYKLNNILYSLSGSYKQVLKNQSGCDSTLTLNLEIVTFDTSVKISDNTLIAQGEANSYQWVDCSNGFTLIPNQNGKSFSPVKSGMYAVLLQKEQCMDTSTCIVFMHTSVQDLSLHLTLSPNPTTGKVVLQSDVLWSDMEAEILNAVGQPVLKIEQKATYETEIDLSGYAAGMYILKLQNAKQIRLFKIIKQE